MCYVTNLDHETDACKSTHPETCRNTTFTWLEHARPSTKSRHIIGAHSRGSYAYNVTVNRYIGRITDTNPIMRRVTSLTCTLKRILVNYRAMQHAKTQPLHYSNTRAWAPKVWQTHWHRSVLTSVIDLNNDSTRYRYRDCILYESMMLSQVLSCGPWYSTVLS